MRHFSGLPVCSTQGQSGRQLNGRMGCQGLPPPGAHQAGAAPAHPATGRGLPEHLFSQKKGKEPGRCQASRGVLPPGRQWGGVGRGQRPHLGCFLAGALHVNERRSGSQNGRDPQGHFKEGLSEFKCTEGFTETHPQRIFATKRCVDEQLDWDGSRGAWVSGRSLLS